MLASLLFLRSHIICTQHSQYYWPAAALLEQDQTKNQVSAPKKQKTALDIVELDHNYCISNAEALNTKLQQETEKKT